MHLLMFGSLEARLKCADLPGAVARMWMHHHNTQSAAADPASASGTTRPEGFKVLEGSGQEFLPFSLVSPVQSWEVCSYTGTRFATCVKTLVLSNLSFTDLLLQAQANMQGDSEVWVFLFSFWEDKLAGSVTASHSFLVPCMYLDACFFEQWPPDLKCDSNFVCRILTTWDVGKQEVLQATHEKSFKPLIGNRCNKIRSSRYTRRR